MEGVFRGDPVMPETLIEKYYGRSMEALYCPACNTFKPRLLIGNPERCERCQGEFVLVEITLRRHVP